MTIDRTDDSGFVTAYPAGTPLPTASTINAFGVNDTVANFAITPISNRGSAYFSDRGTDLIVDVTGYFTGSPMTATLPVPPNVQPPARALLVGDSTLAGVRWYGTTEALLGFPYVLTAESCRRLATASCRGREGYTPTNAVTAIRNASGTFGTVVIMAGYDDWWTVFPSSFDQVVAAARAKGARKIVWLTYREGVGYVNPSGASANEAFVKNNEILRAEGRIRPVPRRRARRLERRTPRRRRAGWPATASTSRWPARSARPTTSRACSPTSRIGPARCPGWSAPRSTSRAPTPTPTAPSPTS